VSATDLGPHGPTVEHADVVSQGNLDRALSRLESCFSPETTRHKIRDGSGSTLWDGLQTAFSGVRGWAKSDSGRDWSRGLGSASLILSTAGTLAAIFAPETFGIPLVISDVVSWVTGAAGTAIDCLREWTSPACVIGGVATAVGPFASPLLSSPRHAEQLA